MNIYILNHRLLITKYYIQLLKISKFILDKVLSGQE